METITNSTGFIHRTRLLPEELHRLPVIEINPQAFIAAGVEFDANGVYRGEPHDTQESLAVGDSIICRVYDSNGRMVLEHATGMVKELGDSTIVVAPETMEALKVGREEIARLILALFPPEEDKAVNKIQALAIRIISNRGDLNPPK